MDPTSVGAPVKRAKVPEVKPVKGNDVVTVLEPRNGAFEEPALNGKLNLKALLANAVPSITSCTVATTRFPILVYCPPELVTDVIGLLLESVIVGVQVPSSYSSIVLAAAVPPIDTEPAKVAD